jgi:sugar (pentulose or hexulose) kinase
VLCLAISVQRASFIVIDKVTGEPFVQLISWSDRRANKTVERINKSLFMRALRGATSVLYWATHKNRFKHASNFRQQNVFVSDRGKWSVASTLYRRFLFSLALGCTAAVAPLAK